jgi:hypothetical protein
MYITLGKCLPFSKMGGEDTLKGFDISDVIRGVPHSHDKKERRFPSTEIDSALSTVQGKPENWLRVLEISLIS